MNFSKCIPTILKPVQHAKVVKADVCSSSINPVHSVSRLSPRKLWKLKKKWKKLGLLDLAAKQGEVERNPLHVDSMEAEMSQFLLMGRSTNADTTAQDHNQQKYALVNDDDDC
jgi:hypothetical protein